MMFYCQSLSTIIVTFNAFNTVFFVVRSYSHHPNRVRQIEILGFDQFFLLYGFFATCMVSAKSLNVFNVTWFGESFFFEVFPWNIVTIFRVVFLYKSWYCFLNYLFKVYPFDVLTCFLYNRWSFFRFSVFSNSKKILNFD